MDVCLADGFEQRAPPPACAQAYIGGETQNGGMITSCICHGCPWGALELDGKLSFQHYAVSVPHP